MGLLVYGVVCGLSFVELREQSSVGFMSPIYHWNDRPAHNRVYHVQMPVIWRMICIYEMTDDSVSSNLAMWYIDRSFVPTSAPSPTFPVQLSADICGYFSAVTSCRYVTPTDVVILIDSRHSTANCWRTMARLQPSVQCRIKQWNADNRPRWIQ